MATFGAIANVLDPPVTPMPQPTSTPTPVPSDGIPALDPRFELVKLTKFDGSSLPSDFYAFQRSDGNEGKGHRDPRQSVSGTASSSPRPKGDVSGTVGQNVKQQSGFWEVRARFP